MSPSWHRPQLSVSKRRGAEKLLVILVTLTEAAGGHSALDSHNSHLLHLKLTSQAVTQRRGGSLELTLSGKISFKL